MPQPLKILFIAAEAFPLVKTGGLGDVAGSLPPALRGLGIDARLLIPAYEDVLAQLDGVRQGPALGELLPGYTATLLEARTPGSGVPLMLVDCPALYARSGTPYQGANGLDWPDNHSRFALLSRAAALLGIAGNLAGWQPDILHANDWHTGLVPLHARRWPIPRAKTVLTIHNLAYQGLFPLDVAPHLGFDLRDVHSLGLEYWGRLSFLKAGLVNADCISTVSPTYAREIAQPGGGFGLEGVIAARGDRVVGIVNGIDDVVWDPARDPALAAPFSVDRLDQRAPNKFDLCRAFALEPMRPIAGVVTRLVEQKGIDVLIAAIPGLLRAGLDLAILGTGDGASERALVACAAAHPGRVGVRIGYDEALSHRIIAGSDILLMPSRFEPCGLTQLYAQRYGCLPVVHRVGGLADTVREYVDGFGFDELTPQALTVAVERAVRAMTDALSWRHLQIQAMTKDLSWSICARQYDDLYRELLASG